MNAQAPAAAYGEADPFYRERPNNLEAEQSLIGALLVNNEAFFAVAEFLQPDHFYEPLHRDIFATAAEMIRSNKVANPVTLKTFMKEHDKVGELTVAQYLARLAAEATTIINAGDYGRAIYDLAIRRNLIRVGEDLVNDAYDARLDADPVSLIETAEEQLSSLRRSGGLDAGSATFGDALDTMFTSIMSPRASSAGSIPFPLPEIGDVLQEDGFQPGNLYALLGSSGEGKTSLMLQIARAAVDAGHPTMIISFDQSEGQIGMQMVSQATGISVSQMRRNKAGERETLSRAEVDMIAKAKDDLKKLPIVGRKLANAKIGVITALVRRWAATERKKYQARGIVMPTPLFILDHNRRVTPEDPRAHEGRIAGAVNSAGKALAEDIGGAVLFLNQRNSKGADRYVPRPIAADLFGGEQAREDYDAILSIYRPERWRDEQLSVARDEKDAEAIRKRFMLRRGFNDEPRDPEGMAEIGAVKVRYGNSGVREFVRFVGPSTKYVSDRRAAPELF
jgi:replicative DNA helicase